jgi:hypothetical protein
LERQFAEREKQLAAEGDRLEFDRQQFARQHQAWIEERAQQQPGLDEPATEQTRSSSVFERAIRRTDDEGENDSTLGEREAAADETSGNDETENSSQSSPASDEVENDVFARLRRLAMMDEPASEAEPEPEPVAHSSPEVRQSEPEQSRRSTAASAPGEESSEESIEDYMSKLLNRMRGGSGGGTSKESMEPVRTKPRHVEPAIEPVQVQRIEEPVAEPVKPEPKLMEMMPRGLPPEASDLAAMREVANLQARNAITTSMKSRGYRSALAKWGVAGVSLGVSSAAYYFAKPDDMLTLGGCVVGLAMTAYWSYSATKLTGQAFAAARNAKKMTAETVQQDKARSDARDVVDARNAAEAAAQSQTQSQA